MGLKLKCMIVELVTKEDLQQFRMDLIYDLKQLLPVSSEKVNKPWLKNGEVRKLLNISANTLQRLRISGKLPSTKIGGVHYYKFTDIERLMNGRES